ncbi:hypothetical protein ES332_A12G182000v1 [Gossypium tomentosum]|uniref:Protein kinase domain-containing protein n=1 Tax=Gossypium tomentosum TaxID=34277 RepID=A0A5D2MYV5_GOSTO|nr:hypothetical protein ES332_A12G182000v1 [Gossypium tomentosum]
MEIRKEKFGLSYVALLCLWTFACGLLSPKGVNFEVLALMGIKSFLVDPRGVLDNWDDDAVDPCSWNLVTCSNDGLVISLAPSQNLSGILAPSIGNLTNLQLLLLQNNNISGNIPSELGRPPKLHILDVSNFSGQIPTTLSLLESLQYLRLNNNSLSGTIPSSLANMAQLTFLQRHNQQIYFNVNEQHREEVCLGNCTRFHFKELQVATNNFSSKKLVRKGGFGKVYKGYLQDGTVVAVKRLKDRNEIGASERLLVYPHISNGSVATRLKAKPALDWGTRKRIALGSARGLLYLHEQCDFGLANLLDHRDSHVTTAVRGTVGHIAPEYPSTSQSSEKTDVFRLGILLLELISGLRALEFGKTINQKKGVMLDWVSQ